MTNTAPVKPRRILVVEDETIVSMDIQNSLRLLGYEVAGAATSGPEAIGKADQTMPDLVLMDIILKGEMDGVEAARRIRISSMTALPRRVTRKTTTSATSSGLISTERSRSGRASPIKPVSTPPGEITWTRIPSAWTSRASALLMPTNACLEAL